MRRRAPDLGRVFPHRALALAALAGALAVAAGCGGSSSSADTAKTNACNARADIATQVQTLQGLPLAQASIDTAKTALGKIQHDLSTIRDAAPDVKGDLKSQLQTANAQFSSQVQQTLSSITSAQSLSAAATALQSAGNKLQTAYTQAFANVRC